MDKLSHLAQRVAGRMSGPDQTFTGFAIDTRQIQRGEVFVALAGEKVDGHEFVAMAARQGAAGALVQKWQDVDLPQVVVPDVLHSLQRYASQWRSQFDIPLIGVTGSNGKTTVKEMLAAVLGQAGPVLATQGNFNNHIGMPLTLCKLRETHRMAVIEMGANHAGEIAELAAIAKPNAGIVTMAGAAHLEGFGSLDTIAKTKGGMFESLPEGGLAVINNDDVYAPMWRDMASHCRQLSFGLQPGADVTAQDIADDDNGGSRFILQSPMGTVAVSIPLPGQHNVMNALGAAAIALGLGLTPAHVDSGLGGMQSVSGRLRIVPGINGAR
ncbi:MAG: UDP-N-acetylmuramoyl-tripeptide--D-alanyl-D-alanine ligase, partial [Salinisphaeraceae bacterium]|nr:UDP-N-acetylmuramoyl-tripeptide--D-alanyl-D-alanine ligase [Salinisphaeraceae bacterium]